MTEELYAQIGIIFRGIGIFMLLLLVLPRMAKEAKVPNGLGRLRRMIFFGGVIYTLTNAMFFITNIMRTTGYLGREVVDFLTMLAGFSVFTIALTLYLIYAKDYGREEKK